MRFFTSHCRPSGCYEDTRVRLHLRFIALLPACTQYSRPELATQGITVVALVTDFEVTCAYPMPDE